MESNQLKKPTPHLVEEYLSRFEQQGNYFTTDKAISKLFQTFPHNCNIEEVLFKVAALNSLYSTKIYAIYEVAKRICELNIDPKLGQKSLELVNEIAPITIRGRTRRNYSFASKYCSGHLPNTYPIYDSYVEQLIWAYRRQMHSKSSNGRS